MAHININTILLNGSLDGPRKIDMGLTQTCIMFVIPRSDLAVVSDEKFLHQHCFYILLGKDVAGKPKAYIGQTYDFIARVRDHQAKKSFWDTALVFVSKTDEIFASEVAFLEFYGITTAIAANNYNLDENKQVPKKPKISPSQESGMELFFRDIKLLTRFYNNCNIFENTGAEVKTKDTPVPESKPGLEIISKPISAEIFLEYAFAIKKAGVVARMRYFPAQKKYVVLAGSLISALNGPSLHPSIVSFRNELFSSSKKCVKMGNVYQLLEDIVIPNGSASAAAKFCAGTSRNGKTDWMDSKGHLIGDYLDGKASQ